LPDEKKGERLIVLQKLPEALLKTCLDKLAQSDLPNLWKPQPDQFLRVEAFPQLGSGKLDLRKFRELAAGQAYARQPCEHFARGISGISCTDERQSYALAIPLDATQKISAISVTDW